ncbi:D-ribose pyranase [Bacillus megaterium]|nr:D-ribose pyranase [Priestia megaterium]
MKRHGMINSHITKILTDLGHTDTIVIADAGLPVPSDVPKIDLSLKLGVPSFEDVVVAVLEDMATEKIVIASEMKERNPKAYELLEKQHILVEDVSHQQLKMLTSKAKVVIRTGEATPYAKCILQAGVIF